jgi:hypothetical protein
MLVEFCIIIEVTGDEVTPEHKEALDKIQSNLEEVIGKSEYCLDNAEWSEI